MIDKKALLDLVAALDRCVSSDRHLNQEGLCGFFYALAITPSIIEPEDWMAELFYGERPSLNGKQVADLKKAVVGVVKSSNKLLLTNKLQFPFDFSSLTDEQLESVWHWANGFLQGLRLRIAFWDSGIVASETLQMVDVVRSSVNIITALVEEDVGILSNLEELKAQFIAVGKEPSDELILASLLPTLPRAYECIRVFAAKMSERLLAAQKNPSITDEDIKLWQMKAG